MTIRVVKIILQHEDSQGGYMKRARPEYLV